MERYDQCHGDCTADCGHCKGQPIKVHGTPNSDDLTCLCGNAAHSDGFDTVLADGTSVEPLRDGPWAGLLKCNRCLRMIDHNTMEVVGWAIFSGPAQEVNIIQVETLISGQHRMDAMIEIEKGLG